MRLIAIVTDIGGPIALHDILSELPRAFGTPIVVMQPTGDVLIESAIAALRHTTELTFAQIRSSEALEAGTVYFAESGKGYLPGPDRNRLLLENSEVGNAPGVIATTLSAFARLLGSELTVVFLSGRGDELEIRRVCSILEQCGSQMLVLSRKESVVDELGQCALRAASSAQELSALRIAAVLRDFAIAPSPPQNTTQNASK